MLGYCHSRIMGNLYSEECAVREECKVELRRAKRRVAVGKSDRNDRVHHGRQARSLGGTICDHLRDDVVPASNIGYAVQLKR
jgi:hypothetical protein